jgi:hypothetical protein
MTQEALKLALEALEEYVNVVVSVNDPNEWTPKVADAGEPARKAITAIKEALREHAMREVQRLGQEIEQEPVKYSDYEPDGIHHNKPPQRTWVGLTDEEIAQGCKESWVTEQAWQSAVWWAEAKLKDKNDVAQKTNS